MISSRKNQPLLLPLAPASAQHNPAQRHTFIKVGKKAQDSCSGTPVVAVTAMLSVLAGTVARWTSLRLFGARATAVCRRGQAVHTSSAPAERLAVITGGTSMLGAAIAHGLARSGKFDRLVIVARDKQKAEALVAELEAAGTAAECLMADLASLAEVGQVCAKLRGRGLLRCLVCAAGATALPSRRETPEGHEYHLGLNFLSRFLMVRALLPDLLVGGSQEDPARVLLVGSRRHWGQPVLGFGGLGWSLPLALGQLDDLDFAQPGAYDPWRAFGQAALCNVLFAYELQRRLRCSAGRAVSTVAVSCVDPGPMTTAWRLYEREENRMLASEVPGWARDAMAYFTRLVVTPQMAAEVFVRLATTPLGGLPCRARLAGLSGGYWEGGDVAPSKYPVPWSPGTSYDEFVWSQLWECAEERTNVVARGCDAGGENAGPHHRATLDA